MAEVKEQNEMMEEECDIITLKDDKGEDVDFYHIATIDYKDEWYIFLQPVEALEDIAEDEVLIYKLGTDEEGEDTFIPIENEDELNAVFNEFLKETESDSCDCGCECEGACEDTCDCGCKSEGACEKTSDCGCKE